MTPERFAQILAAYGARPELWPVDERAAATEMTTDDPELGGQRSLDRLLDTYAAPRPNAALVGRALGGYAAARRSPLRQWWLAALLAATGVLGMATGALALTFLVPASLEPGMSAWVDEQPTVFTPVEEPLR